MWEAESTTACFSLLNQVLKLRTGPTKRERTVQSLLTYT